MDLIEIGKEILKKINSLGYTAYIVGGAVRDYLLNISSNDCDLTTNNGIYWTRSPLATPEYAWEVSKNGYPESSVLGSIIIAGEGISSGGS